MGDAPVGGASDGRQSSGADEPGAGSGDAGAQGGAGAPAQARPMTARRLLGLDRSGPPPPATVAGAPLNPWTIPNAIGFTRLALIPLFLALAFASDDGVGAAHAILFAVIGFGDYLDGLAARATGQYSRLGALLDPASDRLLVVCGVVVCWHFGLLPRWALALLAARELATAALARYGLSRGLDLRINWPGRLAVAPLLSGLALALLGVATVAAALLYVGLALALTATALYLRDGVRALRDRPSS